MIPLGVIDAVGAGCGGAGGEVWRRGVEERCAGFVLVCDVGTCYVSE